MAVGARATTALAVVAPGWCVAGVDGLPCRGVGSLGRAELDALIAEAVVDCYDDDEQLTGLYTMIEDNLAVPFTTEVLGVEVTVRKVDLRDSGIVAICHRGRVRQAIGILDLPLPVPPPGGAQWIEAYRRWTGG